MHGVRLSSSMLIIGFILCLTAVQDSLSVVKFIIPPFNTSAAVGQNATLACIVSDLDTHKVKWKRAALTPTGTPESLAQNEVSLDNRYETKGTYNLTIINVTASDQRMYTCEITGDKPVSKQAYLTVVELPMNLTISWATPPKSGTTTNLTCFADKARPAPTLLWFKDDVEQTAPLYHHTHARQFGYFDVFSTIQVSLRDDDEGSKFRCQVGYDGWDRAMEYTITTAFAGSEARVYTLSLMVTTALIAAFL